MARPHRVIKLNNPAIKMNKLAHIDIDRLPPLAQELVDGLGELIAYKIMRAVGGTAVNVPMHAGKTCQLSAHLTTDELDVVVQQYRGERISVPKYDAIARQNRDAKIRALRGQGWAFNKIALHFGMGERQIYNIIAESDEPPANYDLFSDLP
jgi:hypothetical protein